ncbi:MAG: nitronate monooxygenase [Ardenticatenaceae bacterium]|nr:nitronate monooxygenase [Ardenticatenaceae bacterium]
MTKLQWLEMKDFTLSSPLWVASSHFTGNQAAIRHWVTQSPSAITLKTTSEKLGGDGRSGHRTLQPIDSDSFYCDGPKSLELLNLEATKKLLAFAKNMLPNSKIGISILLGEDYKKCDCEISPFNPDFVELNLKYSFRTHVADCEPILEQIAEKTLFIQSEVDKFLAIFKDKPVFIKLTREIPWLGSTTEMHSIVKSLHNHGNAGLIVANTAKHIIPPTMAGSSYALENGILAGSKLFEKTYQLVKVIYPIAKKMRIPIIATGGISNYKRVLDILAAGASAIQLCSVFQVNGLTYYSRLRERLIGIIHENKLQNYMNFMTNLHNNSLIVYPSSQLTYHSRFYAYSFKDFFSKAKRIDIVNMYGRTWLKQGNLQVLEASISRPGVQLRYFLMSSKSPYIPLIAKMWNRDVDEIRNNITNVKSMLINCLKSACHPKSSVEFYEHTRCPFFSLYLTECAALFVPYSIGKETPFMPIYQFSSEEEEYARLENQIMELSFFSNDFVTTEVQQWELNEASL